ncbi:hypothetical protein DPMN_034428 [Dreissena polymorpha]|uniref:Uncharacterized protein n=1 Tax=Dreissena polymorpha TaxID=45954 RepID=A0A9D4M7I7_DREPO|nr:hypothetical protein DPMN_034428 [Dreissena polymorpha]
MCRNADIQDSHLNLNRSRNSKGRDVVCRLHCDIEARRIHCRVCVSEPYSHRPDDMRFNSMGCLKKISSRFYGKTSCCSSLPGRIRGYMVVILVVSHRGRDDL